MRANIAKSRGTGRGRTYAAVVVYFAAFALLVFGLMKWYLLPGLQAAQYADARERAGLAANALLVLIVVLFALLAGLVLTFRVSRFFFPRPTAPRRQTQYTDAWAESAKRMQTPPEE